MPQLACSLVRPPANLPGSDGGKLAQHLFFCMSVSTAIALALVFVSARMGEVWGGRKRKSEKERSELQARAGLNLHGCAPQLAMLQQLILQKLLLHTHTHNSCNERYYDQIGEVYVCSSKGPRTTRMFSL